MRRPQRERIVAVLETERLVLRAPRREDADAIARLADDRRIAVNTARIPHPYGVDDAEQFIAAVNRRDGEAVFVITLDDALIGACGVDPCEGVPEIGYWLGVPYWGEGYATEAAARGDRPCLWRPAARGAAGRRARQQPGFAARAGKVRLPMDRGAPGAHPRHQFGRADRPLPS